MREIKFRACKILNGKEIFEVTSIDWRYREMVLQNLRVNRELYKLDEYKLLQYTGLKDNNHIEVYEGDLVDLSVGMVGVVEYNPEDATWVVNVPRINNQTIGYYMRDNSFFEVIGNIYENPELLEGN